MREVEGSPSGAGSGDGRGARRPSVVVVGSVNLDLVARCERLPRAGETISGATFERHPGGKGGNQALAAARLGAAVRLVACVGDDDFAHEALAQLTQADVELDLQRSQAPTGVALILVDQRGENQIVVAPGANAALDPGRIDVTGADAVLCQLEIPIAAVATAADRADGLFCLNAAPARELPDEVVARADLLIANRYEGERLPPAGLVGLTQGDEGAVLVRDGVEVARARPPAVEAVDGTGAGDTFTACLLVSLLEGRAEGEALERACAAGALAASRHGAQPSLPFADEVDAILAR